MRKTKLLIATLAMSAIMATTALAGEWKQDQTGWWYQNDDGSYPTNTWQEVDGKLYCFDTNGYMRTGWVETVNKNWYYLNPTGEMRFDDLTENGVTYHFNENGICQNPSPTTNHSQDDLNKNLDAISKGETDKAALDVWRDSQQVDTTPGVNLWDENVKSVTEYHN